jgi:hypothetical protein
MAIRLGGLSLSDEAVFCLTQQGIEFEYGYGYGDTPVDRSIYLSLPMRC